MRSVGRGFRANVDLLHFGQSASIEVHVLAEPLTAGTEHGGHRVDHELGGREVGRRLAEAQRGQLQEDEKVVAQDSFHRSLVQVRDLLGFVELFRRLFVVHANQRSGFVASRGSHREVEWKHGPMAPIGRLVS